jgi:parvulin-like peptidyl-prolyl isomerase
VDVADLVRAVTRPGAALWRAPLVRFTCLGALLFALDLGFAREAAPRAAPRDDDALLVTEAFARGLHESDDVVRRRLAQNLRFARRDETRSDAELVEEALRLGMHESDLVVRRRLAQKMRLVLAAPARAEEPSEAELAAYLAAHAERFTEPARVTLVQLYFRERAGAERALAQLRAGAAPASLGEAIALPRELPSHSAAELAARFGPGFAGDAFAAEDGVWSGPHASAYGHHLVLVRKRTPARVSALATVRSELREALLAERADAAVRNGIAALRAR